MRILYLHQYFKTPEEGGAIRSYYIGKALAEQGHELHMFTSWNGPDYQKKIVSGMQVHYMPVPYSNSMGFWQRAKAFLKYVGQTGKQLHQHLPADLVYATSTPLTVGLLALYLRFFYRIPYVFEVRDLWPEAPVQLGFLRNKAGIALLRWLEQKIYQHASAIVALSPGIAAGVQAVYPHATIHLAPNMADCEFFQPAAVKPAKLVEQWGLQNKLVIAYTGAAGAANHLQQLLEAAKACQEAALPVHFLVAAVGSQLSTLQQQAQGLTNIYFLPYGNKEQVREYLSVSDAVYVCFGPQPVLESCSPNKLFDGLAAGKLCIVSTQGWMKALVEAQSCGFYAAPANPAMFVDRLQPYLLQPGLLQQAQQNARHTAESLFSRQQITAGVVALVEKRITAGS